MKVIDVSFLQLTLQLWTLENLSTNINHAFYVLFGDLVKYIMMLCYCIFMLVLNYRNI